MRFDGFEHMLAFRAENDAGKTALIFDKCGLKKLTYKELYYEVTEKAAGLKESGKTCIGILCDGSVDCVLTVFAANLAGLQVVMLDENTPDELLKTLIEYTDIDVLWGDEELTAEMSPYLSGGVRSGKGKILFFTSGTTMSAKAVVLTDKSLCASAYNGGEKLPLSADDTLLCMLPLNHVFGFVCSLLWGLSCGAGVALGRGMRHYIDDCAYFKPTAVSLVPMLLGFLVKNKLVNPELKLVLVGAGDCPAQLLGAAQMMGLRVSFGYGLTETSSGVAISVSGDPYAMEICPDDRITVADDGEILISAPTCMMQGYYKKDTDTAEVLKDGILYTGDLGRLDADGKLHITGRKKDMIVLPDGTKIFLPEYEAAIAAALGRTELAVITLDGAPVLVVQGDASERQRIVSALAPVMADKPRGQQIRDIIFTKDPMPRTATGKIKRWEIRQKAEEK